MTLDSAQTWLLGRRPEPPATLARRLTECVEAAPASALAGDSMAMVAGQLGLVTLGAAVARQRVAYDAAMDLLAADAFVTYAFEAVSEEGGDVPTLVRRLLAEVPA